MLGCKEDLCAKRPATTINTLDSDPSSDFWYLLEAFEKHVDLRVWSSDHHRGHHRGHNRDAFARIGIGTPTRRAGELPRTFDLFAQKSWRSEMWSSCHLPVNKNRLMNAQADEAFEDLKERMCDDWMVGVDTCAAVRAMVMWLMGHDLDGLMFLLRNGHLHVGNDLFPSCTQEWQSLEGGEAESLLSLAAKDACSPAAVRLLLDHGADPNCVMVPISHNGGYLPECGPGALACLDVRGEWMSNFTEKKLAILTALGNAGGEMCDAWSQYERHNDTHKAEFDLCSKLFDDEIERTRANARQRLETVVALVGIVSFWRRVAAAPKSKAAKAAIARVSKRARVLA